ncbi:hypothetical protein [Winogradskya consettensis]|uniref:hypothetical protein n=1 Tax=Winogradskya consettensis TaxID=113560 RepID=UPI001BB34831|nr:hypothetical protein [Actinoplanes consettensis]
MHQRVGSVERLGVGAAVAERVGLGAAVADREGLGVAVPMRVGLGAAVADRDGLGTPVAGRVEFGTGEAGAAVGAAVAPGEIGTGEAVLVAPGTGDAVDAGTGDAVAVAAVGDGTGFGVEPEVVLAYAAAEMPPMTRNAAVPTAAVTVLRIGGSPAGSMSDSRMEGRVTARKVGSRRVTPVT